MHSRQFEKLTERADKSKEKLVLRMIRELVIHSAIEEMLFYPAVRTAGLKAETRAGKQAAETILESLEEHHVVKWTLTELQKMSPEDERFDAKVKVLMESVRHHVEEEQDELFPRARTLLGEEMLEELGERMNKAKKLAPTRPHPRSPDSPPGNFVEMPVTSEETFSPLCSMNQSAGAPVDISAAIAWAAKYVDPNGFCVFQPAGSRTSAPLSSSRPMRSPAKAASGNFDQSSARMPSGLVKTVLKNSPRFIGAPRSGPH